MKNLASLFSEDARDALKSNLGIVLSDSHDYSQEELEDMFDTITDLFPYEFDQDGNPKPLGELFESIIDVFQKNHLVEFSG